MRHLFHSLALTIVMAATLGTGTAAAQVFGTFAWQMQPYCNVVTLTITQFPAGYTVDGNDSECGSGRLNSATGQALINPDGTVGINFTIVGAGGGDVHVAAVLSPATGSGTWTDDAGNSGNFALGASTGGPARPGAAGTQFRMVGLSTLAVPSSSLTTLTTWSATPAENVGAGVYTQAAGSYVVPTTGVYLVTTNVRWQAFAAVTGYRCIYIYAANANKAASCELPSTTATFMIQPLSTVLKLTAGTAVDIRVFQNSGAAATAGPSTSEAMFTVTRLH